MCILICNFISFFNTNLEIDDTKVRTISSSCVVILVKTNIGLV